MVNAKKKPLKALIDLIQRRVVPFLVTLYLITATLTFLIAAYSAYQWIQIPYPGVFVEHSLAVVNANPPLSENAEIINPGQEKTLQLSQIEGITLERAGDLKAILEIYQPGDEVELTFRAQQGTFIQREIELQAFPQRGINLFFLIPFGVGLIYLISAIWVFFSRRSYEAGRAYVVFSSSLAVVTGAFFDLYTTHQLTYLWTFALLIAGAAAINLGVVFPKKIHGLEKSPYLQWLGYLPAWAIFFFTLPTLYHTEAPLAFLSWRRITYFFSGGAVLFFLGMIIYRFYSSPSPIIRQQSRAILWGAGGSFAPLLVWILAQIPKEDIAFTPFLFLPLVIFPIVIGYAVMQYRILNTETIVKQGLAYTLLTILVVGGYTLLVSGVSLLVGKRVSPSNPLFVGGLVLVLTLVLSPLLQRLQRMIEMVFFRGEHAYQEHLQDFSRALTDVIKLQDILNLLRSTIKQSISPHPLHIYIYDSIRDEYRASQAQDGNPSTDIRFSGNGALASTLSQQNNYIYIQTPKDCPVSLQPDLPRLSLIKAQLFIPIPGRENQILGWLALGPRRSGDVYNNRVIDFLEDLSDQAALALERAQVVADLERRMDEMNVFTRVAQGVNITPDFDDILELIYAQTIRLVPAQDFTISLYDERRDNYYYAFYLEDDIRLLERENNPLETETLAQVVARRGKAIITNDYEQENYARGISPAVEGIYAWMGVPLNVGDETIGSLCLGSRDVATIYTEAQFDLLQAIADQTAGAITKARLLRETQRRARQLKILNEVGRGLTSTLKLNPLLHKILESAKEILDTEAGTLFLVDETTQELVFEVVVGPVADELVGTRLPPGKGHVGVAVRTGQPRIITDVHLTADWAKELDLVTGFQTRDLLIVPMELKGKIIGVIELINKRDGTAFNKGDQELLTSFVSQAAIALDNARLYTQTDQALAARVEELSTMQQIDQELNASLDIERAMQITLENALRQVDADAGFVGMIEQDRVQIMTSRGYHHELVNYQKTGLPLDSPLLEQVTQTGVLQHEVLSENNQHGLLKESRSYATLPISRETDVIGVLMLERKSDTPWEEESLTFLSRLSDHAAIAIANAKLYAEVQEANEAKSEFISFVSHELKTPMTSIRGYSDLLLKGAVGEVNEDQENFLATIRENVDRMAKLVSDLADVSRIETGRLHLDYEAVDMKNLVHDVTRSIQNQIEEKNQTLTLSFPEELPPVWGDQVRINQILTNLVSNAHKYTPRNGKIMIRGELSQNIWDPGGAEEVVHIAVEDNGLGMKKEDQEKIFTKFFRTEEARAGEAPGTGLGLNITRNLVEMQDGKIWFESTYNKGSTFHFTIPVAETV